MTPMLSVHQLLDEVRATERTVFETAQKHLRRLDGRISRQLTQMRKNTEHRERTLNALLLKVAEIRRRLGIDSASPTDEPDYRN